MHKDSSAGEKTGIRQTAKGSLDIPMTPLLETLLQPKHGFSETLNLSIHAADEMHHHLVDILEGDEDRALGEYFDVGLKISEITDQIVRWRFGGFSSIKMLDFASGYGRVTRHYVEKMDRSNLTISDIMPHAVKFQEEAFGVRGIVSTPDPDNLELPEQYDLVQAISLFSHLPRDIFERWLVKLWHCVKPGGVFIFSVHNTSLLADDSIDDFFFSPASENKEISSDIYGSAYASPRFIDSLFEKNFTEYSYVHIPRGLCGFQDMFVLVKSQDVDFSSFPKLHGILYNIDDAELISSSKIRLRGWASNVCRGNPIESIDVVVNETRLASTQEFSPRPDVAAYLKDSRHEMTGWELAVDLSKPLSIHDTLFIFARSRDFNTIMYMGYIIPLILNSYKNTIKIQESTIKSLNDRIEKLENTHVSDVENNSSDNPLPQKLNKLLLTAKDRLSTWLLSRKSS